MPKASNFDPERIETPLLFAFSNYVRCIFFLIVSDELHSHELNYSLFRSLCVAFTDGTLRASSTLNKMEKIKGKTTEKAVEKRQIIRLKHSAVTDGDTAKVRTPNFRAGRSFRTKLI